MDSEHVTIVDSNAGGKHSSMKKVGAAILTVLLISGLVLGVYISRKPTQLAPKAEIAGINLSLKPETTNTSLNQEFQMDVFIDTAQTNLPLVGAQVKINYDPGSLELKNVTLKDFLPLALETPQNTKGSTRFTVVSMDPKQGSGILATLTFKALKSDSTPSQVTFDLDQTEIKALDHAGENVLGTATPATVNFSQSSAPPSSSPSPSPSSPSSPSPSPSASPSSSPSQSPSPTASPNPGSKIGDIDNNGTVDTGDITLFIEDYPSKASRSDVDHDGDVDIYDFNALVVNFGR